MQVKLRVSMFLPVVSLAVVLPSFGDAIPYPDIGSIVPPSMSTAAATGPIGAFFYEFSAGDADLIKVIDTTLSVDSGWRFDNQSTTVGAFFTVLASVNSGDLLEFQLLDQSSGDIYSSNPAHTSDGINHLHFTPYTGGVAGLPAGMFIGGEDRPAGSSDLSYNDDQFVFTNVGTTTIAEPVSMALAGVGLLAAGFLLGMRTPK